MPTRFGRKDVENMYIQLPNECIRLKFQLKTVLLKDSKSNIDYAKMGFIIASIVLQV